MTCREAQDRMAEDFQGALQDEDLLRHLAGCPDCRGVRDRLGQLDEAFGQLGRVEPSRDLLRRTVEAVQQRKARSWSQRGLRWAVSLAPVMVLVLIAVVGVVTLFGDNVRDLFATSANALAGDEKPIVVTERPPADPQTADRFARMGEDIPNHPGGRYSLGPRPAGNAEGGVDLHSAPSGAEVVAALTDEGVGADRPGREGEGKESDRDHRYAPPPRITTADDLLTGERTKYLARKRERTFDIIRLPTVNGAERKMRGEEAGRPGDSSGTVSETGGVHGDEDKIEVLKGRGHEASRDEKELRQKADEAQRRGDLARATNYRLRLKEIENQVDALKNLQRQAGSRLGLLQEKLVDQSERQGQDGLDDDGEDLRATADSSTRSTPGQPRGPRAGATEGWWKRNERTGEAEGTEIPDLAKQSRLVPHMQDGKMTGYKVHGVRKDSDLDRLGIRNGDVITSIGGHPVSSPDKALEAYARVRAEGDVAVEVERHGKKIRLQAPAGAGRGLLTGGASRQESQSVSQAAQGVLSIQARPNAQVFVDGRAVDDATLEFIPLQPGTHRVRLVREGYQPHEATVSIRGGETRKLNVHLEEVPLDQLTFIPAKGYFANTYLPGDPDLTWLRSKLEQGLYLAGQPLELERAAVPYRQPFDAPLSTGLAVYLHADAPAVDGPRRVTLQVGLKGSERHARRRASLHAALIVDLRAPPREEDRRILWTIADSMAADMQAGDRFTLVVAGLDQPLVVRSADFDVGAVRLGLARALQAVEQSGPRGSLDAALDAAHAAVKGTGSDDESTPLGANLVLLASAVPVGSEGRALRARVHRMAVEGLALTTLGVGADADMEALGEMALAGQGRRRLVADIKSARSMVEEELAASGRVVARAVRLRIRLAEGVKLVEVLGSHPLSVVRAEQVREAEKAIDRRVSRTLGIEADRGEDEDGVQIVIPAYYAGDEHVILLDVVVPGPGKVADVRVRYKDLVNLRNAVARAGLNLPAGQRGDDPLVRNVRKNLLAYRLSNDLLQAAEHLAEGRADEARASLARASARIEVLRRDSAACKDDPELQRDANMLAEYQRVLGDHDRWRDDRNIRIHLVRSLAYAGRVKLPPGEPR